MTPAEAAVIAAAVKCSEAWKAFMTSMTHKQYWKWVDTRNNMSRAVARLLRERGKEETPGDDGTTTYEENERIWRD